MERGSGFLMPVASLPSQLGIGSLGQEARNFAKLLKDAKQKYWQVLPLNIVDSTYSPYASCSAFAGNYLLIDLQDLVADGLLKVGDISPYLQENYFSSINYNYAMKVKNKLLKKAYNNFLKLNDLTEFKKFKIEEKNWLDDYCLFVALKEKYNNSSWLDWSDEKIKLHQKVAISEASKSLKSQIDYFAFLQFIFFKQLKNLRALLNSFEIKMIGDIPFYVSLDSVDVWSNSTEFLLDENFKPKLVAGVPPDCFTELGQLWGNPIYNYENMATNNFKWWIDRLLHTSKLYDITRLDHFLAFDSYYAIKPCYKDAKIGDWFKGWGKEIFAELKKLKKPIEFIAEDLGVVRPSVIKFRKKLKVHGMKELQFAFGSDNKNHFLPHNYERDFIGYLGSHDNDTTIGWWRCAFPNEKNYLLEYYNLDNNADEKIVLDTMIKSLYSSVADVVIFTIQDLCYNGSERRINMPGTIGENWMYMASKQELDSIDIKKFSNFAKLYNRD